MADEKRSTPGEGGRRRRPTPTIDLTATEVEAKPQPAAEPPLETASTAKPTSDMAPPSPRVAPHHISHALAGLIGGALVLLALAGVWATGLFPATTDNTGALRGQLATLQAELQAFSKRDAAAPLRDALDDLKSRIDRVEQTVGKASSDPGLGERLAGIETAMKSLGISLTALSRRSDETAAAVAAAQQRAVAANTAELEPVRKRLDALEQSAQATQDKVAQNSGADAAARRALAAIALRDALAQGAPYARELAAVKELGADTAIVGALEPFAATGVPSDAVLSRELGALLPKMVTASGADATKAGGFFERLEANAGKLVRIRPLKEPAGEDASAVLARIEVKLARNDVAGISAELTRLPDHTRAIAEPWSRKLAARDAAIAAGRKLAADSAGGLGVR